MGESSALTVALGREPPDKQGQVTSKGRGAFVDPAAKPDRFGNTTYVCGRWLFDVFKEAGAMRDWPAFAYIDGRRGFGAISVANARTGTDQIAVWKPDSAMGQRRQESVAISPADLDPFQRISIGGRFKVRGGGHGSGFDIRMPHAHEFLEFFAERWPLHTTHTTDFATLEYAVALGLLAVHGKLLAKHLPTVPPLVITATDAAFLKAYLYPSSAYRQVWLTNAVRSYLDGDADAVRRWDALIAAARPHLSRDTGVRTQRCLLALNLTGFQFPDIHAYRNDLNVLFGYPVEAQVDLERQGFFREEVLTYAELITEMVVSRTQRAPIG